MVSIKAASLALVAFIISACSKQGTSIGEGGALDASAPAVASTVAPAEEPPTPASPKAVLEEHRKEMARAAVDGRYADVCKGTPWATSPIAFNKTLCAWVAARAEGKEAFSVEWWRFPGSSLYRGLFNTEHWAHVHGHLLDDHPDQDGRHEVTAVGYKNHCLLETTDTKYTSKGAFDLWVQEQPEAEEVTTNSGAIQHWILLEEMPLAKALMDLAHSRVSVESTATAKDAMVMIAEYQSYAERKGELPVLSPAATAAPSASAPIAVAAPAPPHRASRPRLRRFFQGGGESCRPRSPSPPRPPPRQRENGRS